MRDLAAYLLAASLAVSAAGCADRAAPTGATPPSCDPACAERQLAASASASVPQDSALPITVRSYDGSNQVAHPDVVFFPGGWNGWRYWMALTPLPHGDVLAAERSENPSIYVSNNGRYWTTPPGLTNPVVRPGPYSYLSDPDLHFDSTTSTLALVYREAAPVADVVLQTRSADGTRWSGPDTLFVARPNSSLSPAVATQPGLRLWEVDAGQYGCSSQRTAVRSRSSADGTTWSAAATTDLVQPNYNVWHIDVKYVPSRGEFWALLNAFKTGGDCGSTDLFLATSPDGTSWRTYPTAVLRSGESSEFSQAVYRSTFVYDPITDSITIWYSGLSYAGGRYWHLAVSRYAMGRLLQKVGRPG